VPVISRGDGSPEWGTPAPHSPRPPYPPRFLSIGEFARAARLSPKALRLYDELGLLRPARVDEWSGYRYYSPDQLERARLVAWLRRVGMPLASIADVCDASPAEGAEAVAAFLAVAERDLAERRGLARFLIGYLSGRDTAMPASAPSLTIRYAAASSDIGRERERNQDAAYAGSRLLAVADGMGPGGDVASETVINALRPLESSESTADLLNALSDAVSAATASLRSLGSSDPEFAGSGSTLTAMLLSGSQLALVHIGDTRAYLLRDGGLFQITHDHSVVQSLIDSGRLTPEEASSHPQRSLLLRGLSASVDADSGAGSDSGPGSDSGSGSGSAAMGTPDLSLRDAHAGDRYLLCSDGLTAVVPVAVIRETLLVPGSAPSDVVQRLISLANDAGGPDNIACVVADVTSAA
jgi:PPM family protein phosphatase